MKIKLHIPTEQYGFVEAEFEIKGDETPDEIAEKYYFIAKGFKQQEGITDKDFNGFLDKYLRENTGDLETYNRMSESQKNIIQAIKRSVKRIAPKE